MYFGYMIIGYTNWLFKSAVCFVALSILRQLQYYLSFKAIEPAYIVVGGQRRLGNACITWVENMSLG